MVLCPEFLPRDQPAPAAAPAPEPAPEPAPVPAVAGAPIRERLSGTLQYVFGNDPGFSVDETFGGNVAAGEPAPRRSARHRDPPPLAAPGVRR